MITPPAASLLHGPVPHTLTNVLDWIGTLVFAFSGALVGVQKRFDLFGVLFLAFVVAVVGGMARDVLIGAVPPVAITHLHYFLIAIAGGLIIFWWIFRWLRCSGRSCCSTRWVCRCSPLPARRRRSTTVSIR